MMGTLREWRESAEDIGCVVARTWSWSWPIILAIALAMAAVQVL